jgi:predicted amidophosphoribosyltransferase
MPFLIRRPDPTRCHNCGESVTPYAAGCWLCSAELDAQRWQRPAGVVDKLAARWRALVRRGG